MSYSKFSSVVNPAKRGNILCTVLKLNRKLRSVPGRWRIFGRLGDGAEKWLGCAAALLMMLTAQAQTPVMHLTQIVPVPSGTIAPDNELVMVKWIGGTGPFQVQSCNGLGSQWQDVAGITYDFSQTNIMISPMSFYRVADLSSVKSKSSDQTPPSVPTGLLATAGSSTQVNLTWNASTDSGPHSSGVKGYNVYRNGFFLEQASAPNTSAKDVGLTPGATYRYAVSAVDNAYNESAQSAPVSVTTPPGGGCTYTVSPLNAAFTWTGGSSNLVVTAGSACGWTAASGEAWIAITAGASGTGNGVVSFSVVGNTNNVARTGTLTVAGQTVTVTQAADSTPPSVLLTSPANGATVSGVITLSASASDPAGVTKVEFYRDGGTLLGTSTATPYSVGYDTTVVTNGLQSFSAKAYDAAGNAKMSAPNNVTVSNAVAPATGTCIWSRHFGGTVATVDEAFSYSVKEDKSGNVVAVGWFQGTVDFGGGPVTSTNGQELFIVKYGTSGNYLWSRQISSSGGDQATGVAVDSSNNIVVAGIFYGTVDFGAGPLVGAGASSDIFVAKFSPGGMLLWAKRFGGSATEGCSAITLDATNNILLTGCYGFYGTAVDFGGGPLPLSGGTAAFQYDMYVAKLSPNGDYLWAKGYGGMGSDLGGGIAVDSHGDVAVAGSFQQTASFGGSSFTSAGGYDMFVAKYSGADGRHLWSCSGGGAGDDMGNAVAFDPNGNAVVTGYFSGTANVAGNLLSSPYNPGLPAMFLAKFSSTGIALWARGFIPISSTGQASGKGIAVDGAGNIVLTGFVSGGVNFDGTYLGNGDTDIVLAKFSQSGNTLWKKSYGALGNDYGFAVSIGAGDNILAAGSFNQSANFGCGLMQSAARNDGYVVKTTP